MPDSVAEKVITAVLDVHRWDISTHLPTNCICGAGVTDMDAHRARKIDAALGGLKAETADVYGSCDCGNEADSSWCDDDCARRRTIRTDFRWVSGWMPADD